MEEPTPISSAGRGRPAHWLLLGSILLAGLALRLWSIDFGLPFIYHVDEPFEVYRALRLGTGSFDFERIAKSGYYLVLFLEYGAYFAWLLASGAVKGAQEFSLSIVHDPTPLWMIGRVTTAVIGTLNVWAVYLLGRRLRDRPTGLAAAFLLALTYVHVAHSHYITVDIPLTCLVTVALYHALGVLQHGRRADYVKLAVFAGLAAATKLPGVVILAPALAAHLLRSRAEGQRWSSPAALQRLAGLLLLMGVVYVLINPGILWHAGTILQKVFWTFSGTGSGSEVPVNTRGTFNPWSYYAVSLVEGMGLPLLAGGLLGAVHAVTRRRPSAWILGGFVLTFYLVLALARDPNLIYARYVLPMVPPLVVLAACAVFELATRVPPRAARVGLVALLLALFGLPTLSDAIDHDRYYSRKYTMTRAVEWIEGNVPAGTRVLIEGNPEMDAALIVPLGNTRENWKSIAASLAERDPGKARFLRMKAQVFDRPEYDLVAVRHFEPYGAWESYRADGVELVIRVGPPVGAAGSEATEVALSRVALDRDLAADPDVRLVATFDPDELRAPGRFLRLYRVDGRAARAD